MDLVFETIKGKHMYHISLGNNYMLNPQYEKNIQVIGISIFVWRTWA